jgi:hypothetical protein
MATFWEKNRSGIHPPATPVTAALYCHPIRTTRTSHRLGLGIKVGLPLSCREQLREKE